MVVGVSVSRRRAVAGVPDFLRAGHGGDEQIRRGGRAKASAGGARGNFYTETERSRHAIYPLDSAADRYFWRGTICRFTLSVCFLIALFRQTNTTVTPIQAGSRGVAEPFGFNADIFGRLVVAHADAVGGSYFANRVIPTGRRAYSRQNRQTS